MKSENEIYQEYCSQQPDFFIVDYSDKMVKDIVKASSSYQSYVLRVKGWELIEAVRLELYKLFK